MLLTGILSPDQLKMLTTVVEDHCRARGIPSRTPDYQDVAAHVMNLFQTGRAMTADSLARVLAAIYGPSTASPPEAAMTSHGQAAEPVPELPLP